MSKYENITFLNEGKQRSFLGIHRNHLLHLIGLFKSDSSIYLVNANLFDFFFFVFCLFCKQIKLNLFIKTNHFTLFHLLSMDFCCPLTSIENQPSSVTVCHTFNRRKTTDQSVYTMWFTLNQWSFSGKFIASIYCHSCIVDVINMCIERKLFEPKIALPHTSIHY